MTREEAIAELAISTPLAGTDVPDLIAAAEQDERDRQLTGRAGTRFETIRASIAADGREPDQTGWQKFCEVAAQVEGWAMPVLTIAGAVKAVI